MTRPPIPEPLLTDAAQRALADRAAGAPDAIADPGEREQIASQLAATPVL